MQKLLNRYKNFNEYKISKNNIITKKLNNRDVNAPFLNHSFSELNLSKHAFLIFFAFMMVIFLSPEAFAVSTEALRAPLTTFKKEAFDWAVPMQILAFVGGCVMVFFRMSPLPVVYGAGVAAGLQFFKVYAEASTALIG